jgi:hypothetical protein
VRLLTSLKISKLVPSLTQHADICVTVDMIGIKDAQFFFSAG